MEEFVTVLIKKRLHKEIKTAAAEDERSIRNIASEAIECWLKERKEKLRQSSAILPTKKPDA